MARLLKADGQLLVFVWAFEQPRDPFLCRHKPKYLSEDCQDVLVPWTSHVDPTDSRMRYYHLFKQFELDGLVEETGILKIVTSDYDRDNWYVIARRCDVE